MAVYMMASLLTTKGRVSGECAGRTEESTKGSGCRGDSMEQDFTEGRTEWNRNISGKTGSV